MQGHESRTLKIEGLRIYRDKILIVRLAMKK
jgi:hypothetical protein